MVWLWAGLVWLLGAGFAWCLCAVAGRGEKP